MIERYLIFMSAKLTAYTPAVASFARPPVQKAVMADIGV